MHCSSASERHASAQQRCKSKASPCMLTLTSLPSFCALHNYIHIASLLPRLAYFYILISLRSFHYLLPSLLPPPVASMLCCRGAGVDLRVRTLPPAPLSRPLTIARPAGPQPGPPHDRRHLQQARRLQGAPAPVQQFLIDLFFDSPPSPPPPLLLAPSSRSACFSSPMAP